MPYIGRFAPSPTGPLHLGSLATALSSWLDAKHHHGRWLVRIEDIDAERCDDRWSKAIIETLAQHGLVSDEQPWVQSERHLHYQAILNQLEQQGLVYPCGCTRKDIEQANAQRAFGQNRIYPGTCSNGMPNGKTMRSLRFRCPSEPVQWEDWRLGPLSEDIKETSGDFVLKRGDGFWAYHLAVVADDVASGVTHIVRGEDLADTTARQVSLYQALGKPVPNYWHLPVILAQDGQKLSKQTGATAISGNLPIDNLNTVWQHFGMPVITQSNPKTWLEQALTQWGQYRQAAQSG